MIELCASHTLQAQPDTKQQPQPTAHIFSKGRYFVSAGYGAGNVALSIFRTLDLIAGSYTQNNQVTYSSLGPLIFRAEYGLSDKVGLGLSLNYIQAKVISNYTDSSLGGSGQPPTVRQYRSSFTWQGVSVMARANYHFYSNHIWDVYTGGGLGYRQNTYTLKQDQAGGYGYSFTVLDFPVAFEATIGARLMPLRWLGIYGEAGFGKAFVQGGVVLAF